MHQQISTKSRGGHSREKKCCRNDLSAEKRMRDLIDLNCLFRGVPERSGRKRKHGASAEVPRPVILCRYRPRETGSIILRELGTVRIPPSQSSGAIVTRIPLYISPKGS